MGLFGRLGAKLFRAGMSRLGGESVRQQAKRLGTQAVAKYGGHAVDAAAGKASELAEKHVPGMLQPLAKMAISAAQKKAHAAVAKHGTAGHRLPNGSVRQAIERQRDYGSTAGFKLSPSLTPHGGVPKHHREIAYNGITYR